MRNKGVYNRCKTDHKDGSSIRGLFPRPDYIFDPRYQKTVQHLLKTLGLPMPEQKHIHRGTESDLLFLNHYGVAIRIGRSNIADLIFPANLQPIATVRDKKTKLNVSIYPGIEIVEYKVMEDHGVDPVQQINFLGDIMDCYGQHNFDIYYRNAGFLHNKNIRNPRDFKKTTFLNLDTDAKTSGTRWTEYKRSKISLYFHHLSQTKFSGTRIRDIMTQKYGSMLDNDDYLELYDTHQALRHMADDALHTSNVKIRQRKMNQFWKRCARIKKNPERVTVHHWREYTNEYGVKARIKEQRVIGRMTLHSPWSGRKKDKFTFD